jgi:hypothetical protein
MRLKRPDSVKHLAKAEKHVAMGEQHLARLRKVINDLKRDGREMSEACALLQHFEQQQAMHIAGRNLLVQMLERGPEGLPQYEPFSLRVLNIAYQR